MDRLDSIESKYDREVKLDKETRRGEERESEGGASNKDKSSLPKVVHSTVAVRGI